MRRDYSHLTVRGTIFWVRIPVPKALQPRLGRREWKFSLKTRDPAEARINCLRITLALRQLQTALSAMSELSDDQIKDAARAYLKHALRFAVDGEAFRKLGRFHMKSEIETVPVQHVEQLGDGTLDDERQQLSDRLNQAREELAEGRLNWGSKAVASEFARDQGITFDAVSLESQSALLHALQRATVEEYRIRLAMLNGNYAEAVTRDPLFEGVAPPLRVNWTEKPKGPAQISLGAAFERYRKSRSSAGRWVKKTARDQERVLEWFCEFNETSAPITAVSQQSIRDFSDMLDDLPANFIKAKEFKGKTLPEILSLVADRKDYGRLSQATGAKYFSKLKSFFTWCEEQGYCVSPVGKITKAEPRDVVGQRHTFSKEQLGKIFHSPQYVGHASERRRTKPGAMIIKDGKYWIPLIGMFEGMRLGEIVQLHIADLREEDGVWCFDISRNEDDDGSPKNIKTRSSYRLVPVHPMLLELGLLEYRQKLVAGSQKRLFPDIEPGKDGYYSHNFSKYFSRFLKQIGVKTKKNSFHSFRHNFGDACDRAGLPGHIRDSLMGHADDSERARYRSAGARADLLAENIAKLKFDVDLSHLLKGS